MEAKKKYCYDYPRPALTADCVIFGFSENELKILLIERGIVPFKGQWAFPGGFVHMEEDTKTAAIRELYEETGLQNVYMEQLCTVSSPDRDPRGRVVSVVYFALVKPENFKPTAGDDAGKAEWFSISDIPKLAFDHDEILQTAILRLKGKIRYQPVGFELLPEKFIFSQLQAIYETVLEIKLDRRNFRKKIIKSGLITELNEKQTNVAHRAASYFIFNKNKYDELTKEGFNFTII